MSQGDQLRIAGHITWDSRIHVAHVLLMKRNGLQVQRTLAFRDGTFEFKDLAEGQYTISILMGRGREVRRTVEVRRALLDEKGAIALDIDVRNLSIPRDHYEVSATRLAVPREAREEVRKAHETMADVEVARLHLERALEIAPDFEDALNNLGTLYFRENNFVMARRYFERTLALNPNSFAGHVNLGGTLLSLGLYEAALQENQKAIELRPDDSLAYAQAGISLFFLKRGPDALPYFKAARDIDPLTSSALFIPRICEASGDLKCATVEYERYLKLHAGNPFSSFAERKLRNLKVVASTP
jgi:tetratricopeptide (TPR) repeat protein